VRCLAACLLLAPVLVRGGEILESSVRVAHGEYRVSVSARIDAAPAVVFSTITDYANLAAIVPSIRSSRVLQVQGPDRQRIETVTGACILIFCKDISQVQDVRHLGEYRLEATTLPGMSDLKRGHARWRLLPVGEATELHFSQEFVPDFWVPAIIGTWMIERLLLGEVRATSNYIEQRHAGEGS
jgi:hypothetical protein